MGNNGQEVNGDIEVKGNVSAGSAVGHGAKVEAEHIAGRDIIHAKGDVYKAEGDMYIIKHKPRVEYTSPPLPDSDTLPTIGPLPPGSYLAHTHNPYFTGRERQLLSLAKTLLYQKDAEDVIVMQTAVVSGLGGIGKTQLAVEFACCYGRFFAGGVYWLNCTNPISIPAEVAVIGGKGGMGLYQDVENLTLEEQVRLVKQAWQEPTPRLLIFDNCDGDQSITAEAVLAK